MQKTIALADFAEALSLPLSYAIAVVDQLRELERRRGSLEGVSDEYLARHLEEAPRKFKGKGIVDKYKVFEEANKRELGAERVKRCRNRKCNDDETKVKRCNVTEKEESGSPLNGPSPPVTPVSPIIPSPREEKAPVKGRKARKAFTKPTVDEVLAYCLERKNGIDPQSFLDHYDSNGWMVGRTPMQDWKAAVRTWERRRATPSAPSQPPAQRWESRVNHFDD